MAVGFRTLHTEKYTSHLVLLATHKAIILARKSLKYFFVVHKCNIKLIEMLIFPHSIGILANYLWSH